MIVPDHITELPDLFEGGVFIQAWANGDGTWHLAISRGFDEPTIWKPDDSYLESRWLNEFSTLTDVLDQIILIAARKATP